LPSGLCDDVLQPRITHAPHLLALAQNGEWERPSSEVVDCWLVLIPSVRGASGRGPPSKFLLFDQALMERASGGEFTRLCACFGTMNHFMEVGTPSATSTGVQPIRNQIGRGGTRPYPYLTQSGSWESPIEPALEPDSEIKTLATISPLTPSTGAL
jgi:hypothetical protein